MSTNTFDLVKPTVAEETAPSTAPVRLELEGPSAGADPFGPYVFSEELATAVNVALTLDQPLLVTGEPGTGKTSLAWGVARQLGTEVLEFHTKSDSAARDLFYMVDTLRRFHDASAKLEQSQDARNYITFQALGEAFRADRTKVVLIDEIDKAPRDFANDLLNELDRKEFTIPELSPPERHEQKVRHFVLVTSNSERRLPMPFLRRCVYTHLEFPEERTLERIVALQTGDLRISESFIRLAVEKFLELRSVEGLAKLPATGELVGWVRVLQRMGVEEEELMDSNIASLPGLEAMVKMVEDRWRVRRIAGEAR